MSARRWRTVVRAVYLEGRPAATGRRRWARAPRWELHLECGHVVTVTQRRGRPGPPHTADCVHCD